jgi:hypothetical protein
MALRNGADPALHGCDEVLHDYCKAVCSPILGVRTVARYDRGAGLFEAAHRFRCYSLSVLSPNLLHYTSGSAYCTRDESIRARMQSCTHAPRPPPPSPRPLHPPTHPQPSPRLPPTCPHQPPLKEPPNSTPSQPPYLSSAPFVDRSDSVRPLSRLAQSNVVSAAAGACAGAVMVVVLVALAQRRHTRRRIRRFERMPNEKSSVELPEMD